MNNKVLGYKDLFDSHFQDTEKEDFNIANESVGLCEVCLTPLLDYNLEICEDDENCKTQYEKMLINRQEISESWKIYYR